jgi:hypothetical protein
MTRVQRIERLIKNAELRLANAKESVEKIKSELKLLQLKLEDALADDMQLQLPLDVKTRSITDKWSSVLNFMLVRRPNPVNIDDILEFAAENKLEISRASARAQLYSYVQRGIVERVSEGLYLPTDVARTYCNY